MVNELPSGRWVTLPVPRPKAPLRLFGFPYGGGGASMFHSWNAGLPETIEICAIQFPGRKNRFREKPYEAIGPLIQDLAESLVPFLTKPAVFFGHSLGGLVAFELTRYLRRHLGIEPLHLLVSGHRAPQLPLTGDLYHALPDHEFMNAIQQLNGIPQEALNYPELLEMVLPILRSDFTLCETYRYIDEAPLNCPISAFGSEEDPFVSAPEIVAWDTQTVSSFTHRIFPGDHFFVHTAEKALFEALQEDLAWAFKKQEEGAAVTSLKTPNREKPYLEDLRDR
jgi:medium-chain acyl-[acyl-carrier-protein] hydrolase